MASVSASPEAAQEMAHARAGEVYAETLNELQEAMATPIDHTVFTSRPVDRLGNPLDLPDTEPAPAVDPVEAAIEAAHRKRVLAGTARRSGELPAAPAVSPSFVAMLQSEQDTLCTRLGELRANYLLQERAMLAQIEAVATKVAMAKEMAK